MNLFRRVIVLLLAIAPLCASAQHQPHTIYLSGDSVSRALNYKADWRISIKDIPNGADTSLDDAPWPLVSSELTVEKDTAPAGFRGFAWLRLHLFADTSILNKPLGLGITQYGASEVYLDGRLVESFGVVAPADSVQYYDPQGVPIVINIASPGPHLLAVRYANYAWLHNYKHYQKAFSGIRLGTNYANAIINSHHSQRSLLSAILITLFGIFAALAMVHLILFLYYRADRSNLLFSLFAVCMSGCFLLPLIIVSAHTPATTLAAERMLSYVIIGTCCFLSALISLLFNRRKWLQWVVTCLGIITVAMVFFNLEVAVSAIPTLGITVLIQVFVTTVIAIFRKRPGARILGAGALLFTGEILFLVFYGMIRDGLNFSDDTTEGQLFELSLVVGILAIPVSMSAYLAWRFATINRSLKSQLGEVQRLSDEALRNEAEKQHLLETRSEELEREVAARTEDLRSQKQKSDDLLLNILPSEIAEELKETGASAARLYNNVSVLFTDFVDFTQMSESLSPAALVAEIDACFKVFDGIIGAHNLEKIKTVGDAYIAVSGLPAENAAHAQDVVRAALEIRDSMVARKAVHPDTFRIRLGVHSGPVVAGIVGVKKFAYDIWGDTVNTAARMEQHGEAGKLNISAATFELVKNDFATEYRGELEAKHKGKMGMYFVEKVG